MDESPMRTANVPSQVIGEVGSEAVEIECDFNLEEDFTLIGTVSLLAAFEPCIIAKGKTNKFTTKYGAGVKFMSVTGWMNSKIMIEYLNYVHRLVNREPCALILDFAPAHRPTEIWAHAASLGIELIIVPANGTSLYQPLDRRIFGILKSILRSDCRFDQMDKTRRFETIFQRAKQAFQNFEVNVLHSAWRIPGIEDFIDSKYQNAQNDGLCD